VHEFLKKFKNNGSPVVLNLFANPVVFTGFEQPVLTETAFRFVISFSA
jgi:hypothetical protein